VERLPPPPADGVRTAHRGAGVALRQFFIEVAQPLSDIAHAPSDIRIAEWHPDEADRGSLARDLDALSNVLRAVVDDGAGVSFVAPFSFEEARAFWVENVLPGVRAGTRRVLVARGQDEAIVGTVQLDLAVPPNQRHRADVLKLLVHPAARRRGIARALMLAVEPVARSQGRTLLTLDTWTGSHAETLYRSLDYLVVGVIPRYARGSLNPQLEPATFMYKELAAPEA
jgi:GNAT superfamily N-acetyltransferase